MSANSSPSRSSSGIMISTEPDEDSKMVISSISSFYVFFQETDLSSNVNRKRDSTVTVCRSDLTSLPHPASPPVHRRSLHRSHFLALNLLAQGVMFLLMASFPRKPKVSRFLWPLSLGRLSNCSVLFASVQVDVNLHCL